MASKKTKPRKPARPKARSKTRRAAAPRPKLRRPAAPRRARRSSWLDEESQTPAIERYARKLGTFLDAMADGKVDEAEVRAQESRLVKLMKEIEPELDDSQHDKITRLLCELTAYDLMQVLYSMHQTRPESAFRG